MIRNVKDEEELNNAQAQLTNRTKFSDSIVNYYENDLKPAGRSFSTFTIESFKNLNLKLNDDSDSLDNENTQININEVVDTVFSKSLSSTVNEKKSLRRRIRDILYSTQANVFILTLVFIDSLFVTIKLILEANDKEENAHHDIETAVVLFRYITFVILCIFVVEISVKILVGFRVFLTSCLEIFDAIIVYISFSIDIVYFSTNEPLSAIGKIFKIKSCFS